MPDFAPYDVDLAYVHDTGYGDFARNSAPGRRHEETHRQQLYERAAVTEILRNVGFQFEIVPGYGALTFPAGLVGFVARKG